MKTQQHEDEDNNNKWMISMVGNYTELSAIPLDLTIEILTRLPEKSIFKFRCVSKQWCSIISSQYFQNSYMSMSLSRPRLLLGYDIQEGNESRLFFLSSLISQESNHSSFVSKHDMHESRISPRIYMRFCNSVRGIICIALSDTRFLICNPTTRQVLEIPNHLSGFDPKYKYMCCMFLGYDKTKDEYKILRMLMSQDRCFNHSVCTLERGSFSSWRHVRCDIFYHLRYYKVVCINGVMYYRAKKIYSKRFVVMSFDVWSERLRLIEIPIEDEDEDDPNAINYKGKLATFSFKNDYSYILRVLDDVEMQIWSTKKGVLDPYFRDACKNLIERLKICGTTDSGEIVFVIMKSSEFLFYDLKKNNLRIKVVRGITVHKEIMLSSTIIRLISISCDHVDNIISLY